MIRITNDSVRRIEEHGERNYPEECCGIMLGINNEVTPIVEAVVELENEQGENRRRRFFVTPAQYIRAERLAKERKMELLGFYHSHPDHPAIPSAYDTEHALPWFTYIIVSVMHGEPKNMTAWVLSETRERFEERSLSVEEQLVGEIRK